MVCFVGVCSNFCWCAHDRQRVAALEALASALETKRQPNSPYSRVLFHDAVPARSLEPSTELLGLLDGVEGPNLSAVLDTPLA